MRLLLLTACFLVSHFAFAQTTDEKQIENVINRLYDYVSFNDGNPVKLDSISSIFTADGRLIASFGSRTMVWPVAQYVSSMRENLKNQQVSGATEKEIFRKTDLFGNIAHCFSSYELTMVIKGEKVVRRGINSFQLVKNNNTWQVTSLIWDREGPDQKIPKKYLPE